MPMPGAEVYIDGQAGPHEKMTPGVLVTAEKADYKSSLPETTPAESRTAATTDSADARQDLQLSTAPRRALWLVAVPVVMLAAVTAAFILHRRRVLAGYPPPLCRAGVGDLCCNLRAAGAPRPACRYILGRAGVPQFLLKEVHELSGGESRRWYRLRSVPPLPPIP